MKEQIATFICGTFCGALGLHIFIMLYYGKGRING